MRRDSRMSEIRKFMEEDGYEDSKHKYSNDFDLGELNIHDNTDHWAKNQEDMASGTEVKKSFGRSSTRKHSIMNSSATLKYKILKEKGVDTPSMKSMIHQKYQDPANKNDPNANP